MDEDKYIRVKKKYLKAYLHNKIIISNNKQDVKPYNYGLYTYV